MREKFRQRRLLKCSARWCCCLRRSLRLWRRSFWGSSVTMGWSFGHPGPLAGRGLARESEIEIPVQVNGKLVTVVKVVADADEETIKAAALGDEKVSARLAGKT